MIVLLSLLGRAARPLARCPARRLPSVRLRPPARLSLHRPDIEGAARSQRKRIQGYIQPASKVHPAVLPMRDNRGQWRTVRDNDDRAERRTIGETSFLEAPSKRRTSHD